jgi:hypothetical protein
MHEIPLECYQGPIFMHFMQIHADYNCITSTHTLFLQILAAAAIIIIIIIIMLKKENASNWITGRETTENCNSRIPKPVCQH